MAVAAAGDIGADGEIVYRTEEKSKNYEDGIIVSEEDGLVVIVRETLPTKYENRAELIVNINTATEEEMISLLPGIGEIRAAAIVEYRTISGGFNSVEELCEVNGIGEKIMESLRPYCTTEGPSVQYNHARAEETDSIE